MEAPAELPSKTQPMRVTPLAATQPAAPLVRDPTRPRDLGPIAARFRGRPFVRADLANLALPGVTAVFAPLGYGIYRSSYAMENYGPVAAEIWSRPWFVLSGVALVIVAALLVYRLRLARRFAHVHKFGLHARPAFFGSRRLAWEHIAGVTTDFTEDRFLGLPLRQRQRAVIIPPVGQPVRLDESLERLPDLVSHIKAYLYPRLLPGLKAEWEAGKWLYFGPLAVSQQGLRLEPGKRLPPVAWPAVSGVSVQDGALLVEIIGEPTADTENPRREVRRFALSTIPNYEILLQFMEQGVTA